MKLNENVCKCVVLIILSAVLGMVIYRQTNQPKTVETFFGTPNTEHVFIIPVSPPTTNNPVLKFYITSGKLYGAPKVGPVDNLCGDLTGGGATALKTAVVQVIYPTDNNYIKILKTKTKDINYIIDFMGPSNIAALSKAAAPGQDAAATQVSFGKIIAKISPLNTTGTTAWAPSKNTAITLKGGTVASVYKVTAVGGNTYSISQITQDTTALHAIKIVTTKAASLNNVTFFHCVKSAPDSLPRFILVTKAGYVDYQSMGDDFGKTSPTLQLNTGTPPADILKGGKALDVCVVSPAGGPSTVHVINKTT
jgi:hypothetical protein